MRKKIWVRKDPVTGFVFSFFHYADGPSAIPPARTAQVDLTLAAEMALEVPPEVSIDVAARIVPGARREHLETNLPRVLSALEAVELADKPMILMALATIRAETGSFEPISEFESRV